MVKIAKQDIIRTKLQSKVFDVFGKNVTLISKSAPVYNDRGELEGETETNSSITIVPYNIIDKRQTYEAFGQLNEGEMDAAIPYTVTVNIDDSLLIESERWLIKEIAPNYLPDNVVTIVRLSKKQD